MQRKIRQKQFGLVITILVLGVLLVGCSSMSNDSAGTGADTGAGTGTGTGTSTGDTGTADPAFSGQTLSAEDYGVSITIPSDWSEYTNHELNDEADFQAALETKDLYMITLIENKADFTYGFEEWRDKVLNTYLDSMPDSEVSEPEAIEINGCPATQYTIYATTSGIKFNLLAIYINGQTNYIQYMAWTAASAYEKNLPTFQDIIKSITGA